jgi:hypothetical protein
LNLSDSLDPACSAGATRSNTWGPHSLRFAAVDVIQAASQVSRLIHEARDLNLSVEPASGTGETHASTRPFFSKGDFVTEPRDLSDLVPADVRTELAAVVAALEMHGPAVTKALRRLDRATTAAWNAVNPVDPTEDEWRLVERAVGIERGWNAAYQLVSTLDPPGQGRSPT